MPLHYSYNIFPLGDQALTVDFGNRIDRDINAEVLGVFKMLKESDLQNVIDVVPAYSSLTIFYDTVLVLDHCKEDETAFEFMTRKLNHLFMGYSEQSIPGTGKKIRVPVCYISRFPNDLETVAKEKNISVEEVIRIHHSRTYRVYMIGFLPGFAYMGEVDEKIAAKRKHHPSTVKSGSVAIAGKQTGIYPFESPGGWQVIGRTPMKMFDKHKERPVLLQPGDEVEFYPITEDEYSHYKQRSS